MHRTPEITGKKTSYCTHCGEECVSGPLSIQTPSFCCEGCKLVYTLLSQNNLGRYYEAIDASIVGRKPLAHKDYSFLENKEIHEMLLDFSSEERQICTFELPDIHCSSCIWLLENIHKLTPGIWSSRVNFLKKTCSISYDPAVTTLRAITELLHSIGYTPRFNQDQLGEKGVVDVDRRLYYKLGVAGFCFGNIMLLSFPEYLGMSGSSGFALLGYLNLLLALPVVLYSGVDYLKAAWRGLKIGNFGIDVPIAVGIIILFFRSFYEIVSHSGAGYLDSLSGFVLFLLIGKWFQQFSQQSISFDRDYRSFFPISVRVKDRDAWNNLRVQDIEKGAIIQILHEEIIPCDSILLSQSAKIDYSFVTGEEKVQSVHEGDLIYAGGKQKGSSITLEVAKPVDQSYLTQLWNDEDQRPSPNWNASSLVQNIGHYFVVTILIIAAGTLIYWMINDLSKAFNAATAVLIIACPCVLALSIPFIYGNMLRILARHQVFCRNTDILEQVHQTDMVVFDKTGTLTDTETFEPIYEGIPLSSLQKMLVKSLASQSIHPLSQAIFKYFEEVVALEATDFKEYVGSGVEGLIEGHLVRLGAPGFIFNTQNNPEETTVLIEIDSRYTGRFIFRQHLRRNIHEILQQLHQTNTLILLTGDGDHDEVRMKQIFPDSADLYFKQTPIDKLNFIRKQQGLDQKVMMIGDGLNDAGALKQSDIGIVVSQSSNNFTPACDMIISRHTFGRLAQILDFIKKGRRLLYGAFFWAFLYNSVGLYFAVTGQLSPVVAAILMPVSSITIMGYALISTHLLEHFTLGLPKDSSS